MKILKKKLNNKKSFPTFMIVRVFNYPVNRMLTLLIDRERAEEF